MGSGAAERRTNGEHRYGASSFGNQHKEFLQTEAYFLVLKLQQTILSVSVLRIILRVSVGNNVPVAVMSTRENKKVQGSAKGNVHTTRQVCFT